MVNDIKPVNTSSLLIKYADDITVSVPIKSCPGQIDPAHQEVCSIKLWADDSKMTLNFKKTFEMVVRGKTWKTPPGDIDGLARKKELKLLGVTFNEDPCDWNTQFEHMLGKANSRLYILKVCEYFDYSFSELTVLFDSLIMSLFLYALEVWACAHHGKYIAQINKFCRRALRYGYTSKYTPMTSYIVLRDRQLWNNIKIDAAHPLNDLLPPQRPRFSRSRGHDFILPRVRTREV